MSTGRARQWSGAALIAAAVGWIYWPALRGGWVWDDWTEIPLNGDLRAPLGWAKVWYNPAGPDYLPLKTTVQWLMGRLWGQTPLAFHVLTAALHVAGALLLWRLLRKLTIPGAFLGGLLFAVHPVAVESVAWIAELKNTLSLPLALLAFIAYLDFVRNGRAACYAAAWVCFVAALLCKTSVVMLPCVLLLSAWWRTGRIGPRDWRRTAPFFGAALVLGGVTVWFQQSRAMTEPAGALASRMAAAGLSAAFYLGKFLWPRDVMPVYPRWNVEPPSAVQFLPWLGLAAAVVWLIRARAKGSRSVLFALGAVLLNLLPALGFVRMAYLRIAWAGDHLGYVALAAAMGGVAAAWGWADGRCAALGRGSGGPPSPRWLVARAGLMALAAVAVAALGYSSRNYAAAFRSDAALWQWALERNPRCWLADNNLGLDEEKAGQLDAARAHFEAALAARPMFPEAEVNWGDTCYRQGEVGRALMAYRRAIAEKPGYPDAHARLALALARTGDWSGAAVESGQASALRPGDEEFHRQWADALGNAGQIEAAMAQYREALRLQPEDEAAEASLGLALVQTGQMEQAIGELQQALKLQPGAADAEEYLGLAYAKSSRWEEAIAAYREALKGDADNPDLHANLADALRAVGRLDEAQGEMAAAQQAERGESPSRRQSPQ